MGEGVLSLEGGELSLELGGLLSLGPGQELSLEPGGVLSLERGRGLCRELPFATSANREFKSASCREGGGEALVELSLELVRLDGGRPSRGYCIAAAAGRANGVDVRRSCRVRSLFSRCSCRDRRFSKVKSWRGAWSSTDCPMPMMLPVSLSMCQSAGGSWERLVLWARCLTPCWCTTWVWLLRLVSWDANARRASKSCRGCRKGSRTVS